MIRVGVIGLGAIGVRHAQCYTDDPLSELVAVCDVMPERAEQVGAKFAVAHYSSVQDMVESANIDAVSVCTAGRENGGDHYEPVMAALSRGKHVLCEKPLSNDIALAREMVHKADEMRVCLGTNLNHRFVPMAWQAKKWIDDGDEGKVGTPLFGNMVLRIENPNESSPFFHFRAFHPHSLDVMRFFLGDTKSVHCFANRSPGRVCWSNLSMNLEYESGAIGHLSGSYDAGTLIERCEVAGTNGRFVIEGICESLHYHGRRGGIHEVYENPPVGDEGHTAGFEATFKNRVHYWLKQLSNGTPPDQIEASGRAGLHVQEIIEAAIKSFQTRTVVDL